MIIRMKHTASLVILPAILLSVSCVEDIDIDVPLEDKIVVNCLLTTDSVQHLSLTHNALKNAGYFQDVDNAVATLSSGGIEIGTFRHSEYGDWNLDFTPIPGEKYELNIKVDGFDKITAETIFPHQVKISKSQSKGNGSKRYFKQMKSDEVFWMFHLTQRSDTLMKVPVVSSSDVLQESIGTSHPGADDFNASDLLMFSNMGGGGTTREHLCYIRVLPVDMQGMLEFYVEGFLRQSLMVFRAVSDEYDRYLKTSLAKMMLYENSDDSTQYLDESSVYSNINGGLGIFGAYSDCIIQFSPITDF